MVSSLIVIKKKFNNYIVETLFTPSRVVISIQHYPSTNRSKRQRYYVKLVSCHLFNNKGVSLHLEMNTYLKNLDKIEKNCYLKNNDTMWN